MEQRVTILRTEGNVTEETIFENYSIDDILKYQAAQERDLERKYSNEEEGLNLEDLIRCKNIPEWARWAAQDSNGSIWVYEFKPVWNEEFGEWKVKETGMSTIIGNFSLAMDRNKPLFVDGI